MKVAEPAERFYKWWDDSVNNLRIMAEASDLDEALLFALAAWQAALAAQSTPVDWEKVVREKFPNADSRDGAIWKSKGSFTILGYSWQHAAHHPDVIGQDKWEGEDGKRG